MLKWSVFAANPSLLIAVWSVLVALAVVGLVAMLSPRSFAFLARGGSRWVDTNRVWEVFDRQIDIDRYVLPHARWLGVAVVAAIGVLAYFLAEYRHLPR